MGILKIIISVFTFSYYFAMNGAYNVVLGSAKMLAVRQFQFSKDYSDKKEQQKLEFKTCYKLCWFAVATSLIYLVLSFIITFYFQEIDAKYNIIIVSFIATVGFSKLIVGIVNSIKTKKNANLIIHYIKLINLVDACISISLVQRAVLMMLNVKNANFYSGIGGIVFSCIALLISVYMIIELSLIRKNKLKLNKRNIE